MKKNNMDLEAILRTREEIQKGEFPEKKAFLVEGQWLLDGEGQFQATLEYPQGSLRLISDQPPPSGGEGRAPNPVQYCVFAFIACYATTFVTLATQQGVTIRKLRARGASEVNMKAVFDLEEGPIVEKVWIELEVESDASEETLEELRRLADEKCPAAFTVRNAVPFESKVLPAP